MDRVEFTTSTIFGGQIQPAEYTDRETGEVKLSAPKVQLLQQDDNGRLRPIEMKTATFIEKAGVEPEQLEMGDRVELSGAWLIRDGFQVFDQVRVVSGSAA